MNKKIIAEAFFTIMLLILLATFSTIIIWNPKGITHDKVKGPDFVGTVLAYAAQPFFSNENILEQVYGITDLQMEIYNVNTDEIYFSVPPSSINQLNPLVKDLSKIRYSSVRSDGIQELGDYLYRDSRKKFFMTPKGNIKVDPNKTVSTSLFDGRFVFPFTLGELSGTLKRKYTYNGYLYILRDINGVTHKAANHSAYISKKGEPGLVRLVDSILEGNETIEEKIQKLLSFVSFGIEWNNHGISDAEIMKKPIEILLSGKADCSGKTTLFASLLEQIDVDYILVYYRDHINVAVKGNFRNLNNCYIDTTDGKYFIAETTIPGFQIGITFIKDYRKPVFIQSPGGPAYDYRTGKKL